MATVAHCLYCFEVLSASLEKRGHLSLPQVEKLWAQYQKLDDASTTVTSKQQLPHDDTDPPDCHREDADDPLSDDELDEASSNDDDEPRPEQPTPSSTLRLPSISRLQAPSPASASTSSTPSTLSTSSSRQGLSEASSKTSSSSSFFSSFGRRSQQPSPAAAVNLQEEKYPLFVTWNTVSGRSSHRTLRGCIGTFDAQDLSSGLENYTLTAAFDDTRFPPIRLPELSTLSTTVTLLHTFTPCAHPLDWEIGTHGLRISFSSHGHRYGATYLPDVAVEQGWTKEETVVSLMRKAGWVGRHKDWRGVGDLRAVRYQGKGESVGWDVWREWRGWVEEMGER
ncbi:MAG: hypothetical protein Q9190_004734 [Brigantiaea leucoxantha]